MDKILQISSSAIHWKACKTPLWWNLVVRYYKNHQLHRLDGPAILEFGSEIDFYTWWRDGHWIHQSFGFYGWWLANCYVRFKLFISSLFRK